MYTDNYINIVDFSQQLNRLEGKFHQIIIISKNETETIIVHNIFTNFLSTQNQSKPLLHSILHIQFYPGPAPHLFHYENL